jgi:[ribosomal protein S5]-alanine N-acetyltransferase
MEIRLRMVRPTDVEGVYRLLSDMNVVRYMLFPLFSRADAEVYVGQLQPMVLGPNRYAIDRVIAPSEGDELLGLCGLVVDRDRDEAEAWYLLDPALWGQGITTAALHKLLHLGFEECGLHRIWACCVPENGGSARVLEKAGMRREGHMRKNLRIHGEWMDSFVYAMLAEEWRTGGD